MRSQTASGPSADCFESREDCRRRSCGDASPLRTANTIAIARDRFGCAAVGAAVGCAGGKPALSRLVRVVCLSLLVGSALAPWCVHATQASLPASAPSYASAGDSSGPIPVLGLLETLGPSRTPAPTSTVTQTPTSTSTQTPTATPAPTPTEAPPLGYAIKGIVIDERTGLGLAGAVVRLWRGTGGDWHSIRETTTVSGGIFYFEISPQMVLYRLTEDDPEGYVSVSASLAPGVDGSVLDANLVRFSLPTTPGLVHDFVFVDTWYLPVPTPTSTDEPTMSPPPVPTSTPSPSHTPSNTIIPTPTRTSTPTPTSTLTATATLSPTPSITPTPTATPTPIRICYCSGEGEVIYRVHRSLFHGYTTEAARDSDLRLIGSPPAPFGWSEPEFVTDRSWLPASEVWEDFWSAELWKPQIEGCTIVGLSHPNGEPEWVRGDTHLIRRKFLLQPPESGMGLTETSLTMWSDNKTAWWWEGSLVSTNLESFGGTISIYPDGVNIYGGLYTLAIQNSNDFWQTTNPQGVAFELCVTWSHIGGAGRVIHLPLIHRDWQ